MASQLQPNPKDAQIKVTNIVAKSFLVPPFSLASLYDKYSPVEKNFPGRFFKFVFQNQTRLSVFQSGAVISRGSNSISTLEAAFSWLRELLKAYELSLAERYEILNVVGFSQLSPFSLSLFELASHLPNCSFDPTPPPTLNPNSHPIACIVFSFGSQSRTALIFSSGKSILTGFKSIADLQLHAAQLAALIAEVAYKYPEVIRK